MTVALVYGARMGCGGLGQQAATAAAGLRRVGSVVALGPGALPHGWHADPAGQPIHRADAPPWAPPRIVRWLLPKVAVGELVYRSDAHLGRWAAKQLKWGQLRLVYAFTQVGLEALQWAAAHDVPTVLDNPNGHIRNFAAVYRRECRRWGGGWYRGHPIPAMVRRVEAEYELADRIRVSSEWARQSMVEYGVPGDKITVVPQPIDTGRFTPAERWPDPTGPLRVCYVGSLDLRKGFVYLLRAVRQLGADRVHLTIAGNTGDRASRKLFEREARGLTVHLRPGDPVPVYHRAELFVLPSLEDGFGFVTAEALACGLPVAVTDQCGASEWVRPGETGWVLPAGSVDALTAVLDEALTQRHRLADMGREARRSVEVRDPAAAFRQLVQ